MSSARRGCDPLELHLTPRRDDEVDGTAVAPSTPAGDQSFLSQAITERRRRRRRHTERPCEICWPLTLLGRQEGEGSILLE